MLFTKNQAKVHTLIMEQYEDVKKCFINFENFIRAAVTPGTPIETLASLSLGVASAENEADVSLRNMIDSLSANVFLPQTKEDLITIATSCDKVANKCEYVAKKMLVQKFFFPADYAEDVLNIVSTTHEQFDVLTRSISQLFAKFGDFLKDHSILDEIRALESGVDKIEQKLYANIFELDLSLAEKLQLTDMIESLSDISDIIENIADKIQIILITRKA